MNATVNPGPSSAVLLANGIGDLAAGALLLELGTWPKPGLVSHLDSGSHSDMDAGTFRASAEALRPFFSALAEAGAADAEMADLRAVGLAAEQAMLEATDGANTHRGAIFGLGLLCAAAGALGGSDGPGVSAVGLGAFVRDRWGDDILGESRSLQSHGARACRRYGVGGARTEAATGFPHVHAVGLPALRHGRRLSGGEANAARVQACFALIAALDDTNLLHRGGEAGLRFARRAAGGFLHRGGVGQRHWLERAAGVHRDLVARRLSPGGSADLLAATLLVDALETAPSARKRFAQGPPAPAINLTGQ